MPSAHRGKRWLVMPALFAAGLGVTAPVHATARSSAITTTVYVASYVSGTIAPVNAATGKAGTPIRTIGQPLTLAATPDGRTVYVASIDNQPAPAQEYVTPISTATGKPGTPIPDAGGPMAMSPDGSTLYATGDGGIVPISTATSKPGAPIPLPAGEVRAIIISRDGRRAYAAVEPDSGQGTVTAINLVTGRPGRTICTGMRFSSGPESLALTPDGSTVYAGGNNPSGFILPAATASMTAGTPIRPPGNFFDAMQVSADGKTLWALAANGFLDRISTSTGKPLPAIRIRGDLETMTVTPKTIYVGQRLAWGRVVPVNAATGVRGPDIPGARFITAAALSPDGKTLWALGLDSGTALPVSVATNTAGRPVPVGDDPGAVVVVSHRT